MTRPSIALLIIVVFRFTFCKGLSEAFVFLRNLPTLIVVQDMHFLM